MKWEDFDRVMPVDSWSPYKETNIECPKCGRKIPLVIGDKCKCPKCDGELYAFIVAEYD